MRTIAFLVLCLHSICLFASPDEYSENTLSVKEYFESVERKGLAQEFQGLRTSAGIQSNLYPIRKTGVSTEHIVDAAKSYLDLLSPAERIRSHFGIQSDEWRKWFNVDNGIYVRQGLSLKEMSTPKKTAAMQLLEASLSEKGLQLSFDIMKTDATLSEINGGKFFLDEELYYITIMGIPSKTEPWGWQLDGHHLVINYFVMGDQVVMTPTFWGAEPATTASGKYKGNQVLQDEQNLGLAFMQSLSTNQQKKAVLDDRKVNDDMQAGAHKDNMLLDFAGLKANDMTLEQKTKLLALIKLYVSNMKEGHAKVRMEEVNKFIDDTWFAWIGEAKDHSVFYYRIHSPVILIEFDHQLPVGTRKLHKERKPVRDHIHIIVRTPNGNDYGKDLLGQHLKKHKH